MQYLLRKLLEPFYNVVAVVADGLELIEAVKLHKPDGVLMDVSMPVLNGIIAAKRLQKIHPEVKIIFVSAHLEQEYVDEAYKVGAAAYLGKNALERDLLKALGKALSREKNHVSE